MAKIKLQIKDHWSGSILFEYEKENNTIKDTLIEAVKGCANLRGADLSGAKLNGTDLMNADLSYADLRGANLSYSYLSYADLRGADLSNADLSDIDLRSAFLRGAKLRGADLSNADLVSADLVDADLSDIDLRTTSIRGAKLRGVKGSPYVPLACPSDGAFVGWKKAEDKLIKLLIPEDAKRCSATTQKCRCSKAMVLEITDLDGTNSMAELKHNAYDHITTYKVGEMVLPDSFDENRWNECSHGIHFFVNKQDAIDYQ